MPSKGTISKFHGRHNFIDKTLWKKYMKETGNKISFSDFKKIINTSITESKKWIIKNPIGFKFPHKIGNLAINRFKTYGDFKTYFNNGPGGSSIVNHNLHTGGYTFKIQWFHCTSKYKDRIPIWFFDACRDFKRSLAATLKSDKSPNYNTFMQDHFREKSKYPR